MLFFQNSDILIKNRVEGVFTEVPICFYENAKKSRCLLISGEGQVEIFYFERRPINEDFSLGRGRKRD